MRTYLHIQTVTIIRLLLLTSAGLSLGYALVAGAETNETATRSISPTETNTVAPADTDGDGFADVTVGASDTNVCDGVTCADGSCAATSEACSAEVLPTGIDDPVRGDSLDEVNETFEMAPDVGDADSDGDGLDDGTARAQNHNSSRSNQTNSVAAPATSTNAGDTTNPANYNNSRSNRTTIAAPDTNVCDGVTCPDGSCAPTNDACNTNTASARLVNWQTLETANATSSTANAPIRQRVRDKLQAVRTTLSAPATESAARPPAADQARASVQIAIDARALRDLDDAERNELARLRTSIPSTTPAHHSLRLAERVIADDRVETLTTDASSTTVTYRARMNLLGIFPIDRVVTAHQATDARTPTIDYPWYHRFAQTPDTPNITQLLTDTIEMQTEIQMSMSADPL